MWDMASHELKMVSDPSDQRVEVSIDNGIYFAVEALQWNYRLNWPVISCLGLFNDAVVQRLIATAIQLPDLIDSVDEKKKEDSISISVS